MNFLLPLEERNEMIEKNALCQSHSIPCTLTHLTEAKSHTWFLPDSETPQNGGGSKQKCVFNKLAWVGWCLHHCSWVITMKRFVRDIKLVVVMGVLTRFHPDLGSIELLGVWWKSQLKPSWISWRDSISTHWKGKKKELTALSKHTLISLFHLNSAKNLDNSLKHSHTKWNLNHK